MNSARELRSLFLSEQCTNVHCSCYLHCSLNSAINMNSARKAGKNCLRKTAGETSNFCGSHDQNTAAEDNQTQCYCV